MLAIGKLEDGSVSLRVHPTLIPRGCSLASVKNEFNAVMLDSEFLGQSLFVGRGAGARPTATAVVADIVDIATGMLQNKEFNANRYSTVSHYPTLPADEIRSRYYLRLATEDLAQVSGKVVQGEPHAGHLAGNVSLKGTSGGEGICHDFCAPA